jgi:hypothetical protein
LGFDGPAGIGEVEDYFLPNSVVSSVVLAGDYDLSGTVDDADHSLWRSTFGSSTDLRADGNDDGVIDTADYVVWRRNRGATSGTGTASGAGSLEFAMLGLPVLRSSGAAGQVSISPSSSLPQLAAESVESGTAETSLLVGLPLFNAIAISTDSDSSDVLGSAAVIEAAADSSLLLLDRALADLTGSNGASDDDVWCNTVDEDESVSDMALAAVLDEWDSL